MSVENMYSYRSVAVRAELQETDAAKQKSPCGCFGGLDGKKRRKNLL